MRRVVVGVVSALLLFGLGLSACSSGGGDDAAGSVLQFRLVEQSEPSDCGALPDAPNPEKPYSVLLGNQCATLSPASVGVDKAKVEIDPTQQRPSVVVVLTGDDAEDMNELIDEFDGRTLAVVAFGKILVSMPVPKRAEGGRVTLPPIGRNDATRLRADLKP
jgi:hypothetical protein